MTAPSELPPLESGIPIPPPEPQPKRKRTARGLTPWRKHILSARPGQSVVVGWFDRGTVLSACRDYGILTRTQRVKGENHSVRIWFLNVAPKKELHEQVAALKQRIATLENQKEQLRRILGELHSQVAALNGPFQTAMNYANDL